MTGISIKNFEIDSFGNLTAKVEGQPSIQEAADFLQGLIKLCNGNVPESKPKTPDVEISEKVSQTQVTESHHKLPRVIKHKPEPKQSPKPKSKTKIDSARELIRGGMTIDAAIDRIYGGGRAPFVRGKLAQEFPDDPKAPEHGVISDEARDYIIKNRDKLGVRTIAKDVRDKFGVNRVHGHTIKRIIKEYEDSLSVPKGIDFDGLCALVKKRLRMDEEERILTMAELDGICDGNTTDLWAQLASNNSPLRINLNKRFKSVVRFYDIAGGDGSRHFVIEEDGK